MTPDIERRLAAAKSIALEAGVLALKHFRALGQLEITQKGVQDLVSNADIEVEALVRSALADQFPDDGIVGEEDAPKPGTSGYTWVIDPIDGTANFVRGIPTWAVVLAVVLDDETKIGVIHDPVHDETFWAVKGDGAFLNQAPMKVATTRGLDDGTVGVGFSFRTQGIAGARLVEKLVAKGGVFYRNASGAISLAYVASGRLIGYCESHMNAWDCLAGQLMVAEAGGTIEAQSADAMIADGGRVITATPAIFDDLIAVVEEAYGN